MVTTAIFQYQKTQEISVVIGFGLLQRGVFVGKTWKKNSSYNLVIYQDKCLHWYFGPLTWSKNSFQKSVHKAQLSLDSCRLYSFAKQSTLTNILKVYEAISKAKRFIYNDISQW